MTDNASIDKEIYIPVTVEQAIAYHSSGVAIWYFYEEKWKLAGATLDAISLHTCSNLGRNIKVTVDTYK